MKHFKRHNSRCLDPSTQMETWPLKTIYLLQATALQKTTVAEAQDKIATMDMFTDLRGNMDKCF